MKNQGRVDKFCIKFNIWSDSSTAAMEFEESFKQIGECDPLFRLLVEYNDAYIYLDHGNVKYEDVESELRFEIKVSNKISKASIEKVVEIAGEDWGCGNDPCNKDDAYNMIDSLIDDMVNNMHYNDFDFSKIDALNAINGVEVIFHDEGFEVINTRGYSQGDFAQVIVPIAALERVWGNKPDLDATEKEIHHLLWDAPARVKLQINWEDYDDIAEQVLYDLTDEYDYIGPYEWKEQNESKRFVEEFVKAISDEAKKKNWNIDALKQQLSDEINFTPWQCK